MSEEDFYYAQHDEAVVSLEFFVKYMDAVRRNWDELSKIKECYFEDYRPGALGALADISVEDQDLLWRATTKGSVYSTDERDFLKNGEDREGWGEV